MCDKSGSEIPRYGRSQKTFADQNNGANNATMTALTLKNTVSVNTWRTTEYQRSLERKPSCKRQG